jgi:flagellar biosynthesis protein FlhA
MPQGSNRLVEFGAKVSRNLDVPMVFAILFVMLTIIIPLPPFIMDFLLIINITLGMVIMLTVIYLVKPLDFSVFPSLLLITTFFRLALNVATTRLILSNAGTDQTEAAGQVVEAFGHFVVGDNIVVGAVIFIIIFIIQFVVITKGASRISEVAARFTLDAMPGKQLSIDADLNAGLIDEQQAKFRREQTMREADFFGAMDGASKFVRGDAVAGIIITIINIVGGLIIGFTSHNMGLGEALEVYTKLTIGDGLVSQVPALVISIASGLLVTRNTAESDLGKDFFGQLLGNSKAMYLTAGFLIFLLPSGLPSTVLVAGAAFCGGLGYMLQRVRADGILDDDPEPETDRSQSPTEKARSLLTVDPMELEVGYGLVGFVDQSQGGTLLARISSIREQVAMELGLVVPAIRIRDNMQLDANSYVLKLRGVPIGGWQIVPDHYLAMEAGNTGEQIDGIQTTEPSFQLPAVWIPEAHKSRAEAVGYTVVDATSVIATHLTELIRLHAAELLTREEVSSLIDSVKEKAPALVEEVIPDVVKIGDVQKVLQNLLNERVSIRDLEIVLETLGDYAPRTKDAEILTEYVRNAMGRSICQAYRQGDGKLHVVTFDPSLEDYVNNSIEHTDRGSYLTLSPEILAAVTEKTAGQIEKLVVKGFSPIVLCAPQVRSHVRNILDGKIPGVVVISYNEVVKDVLVESHGNVMLDT